jgi:hypothetical protein
MPLVILTTAVPACGSVGGWRGSLMPPQLEQVVGSEVELVDHVEHEPGQVAFGEPVAQVLGEQEGLVAVAAKEIRTPWRILQLRGI